MRRLALPAALLSACAGPDLDPAWADVAPADPAAEVDLALSAASLPLQLWLWLSGVEGCAAPACPSVVREGDRVVVTGDCVDEQGVGWQGRATFEGEGARVATLSAFGPAGFTLDGQQVATTADDRVELESDGLALTLERAPEGLSWDHGPQTLAWPRHLLLLDQDGTWAVEGQVVLDAGGEQARTLLLSGEGWAEGDEEGQPARILGQARLWGQGEVTLSLDGDPWAPQAR
ncbi:hypothetical protein L6R53_09810 [Myxococcota bacterium]|nr:hypothetical protein [Myxococcota bacterium]